MQFGTVVSERRQILSLVHDDGWWGRVSLNPLHANISIHVLHTALFTFPFNMTRRIYWNIFILNYDLYLHYTPQELKNWTISNTSVYLRLHDMKCCWTGNNRVFFVYIYRATNILYSSLLLILTSACIIDNNKSYLLEVHARLGPKQNAKAWSWFTFISGLLNAETGITIGKLFSVLIGKLTLVIWRLYSVALSR